MKTISLTSLGGILVLFLSGCSGKEDPINYFNQKPVGTAAEVFAPNVISTAANEHSAIAFSPDGSCVLWAVMDKHYRGRLFEMTYSNGTWSNPATPSFADTLADYYSPTFSMDGQTLLFNSKRTAAGYREGRGNRIWLVERTTDGWGTPVPFDSTVSKSEEFSHSISKNGTIYFASATGSAGTSLNIARSEKVNDKYTTPVLLPYNINSSGYEDGPYIAPDEDYLIFESTRAEGIQGSHDLYISFRKDDGNWRLPINMGPKINSPAMERFPRVSPDGKYLFFASNRDQSSERIGFDIYWIDTKVIDELRTTARDVPIINPTLGHNILDAIHTNDSSLLENSLTQWLSSYPTSLDAIILYSSILRKQKRFAEAEQLLTEKTTAHRENASVIKETAFVKYGLNKDDEAERLLAPLLKESADIRHRYLEISNPLFDMGKYDASDKYFEKAMAIQPNGGQYYNRACGYAHLGETRRVFENLNKAADNGFNSKQQFENDPDLAGVKSDRRFKALLAKLN